MKYKVLNAMKTGSFQSKFGEMFKYAVSLEGEAETVELIQKPETPAPSGEIEGSIEVGQYGRKFKKEQVAGGFSKGGFKSDPNTMLISYAKDLTVALINRQSDSVKVTADNIMSDLDTFTYHIKGLYDSLAGAKPEVKPVSSTPNSTVVSANNDNEPPMPKYANDVTPDQEISSEDINNLPF